VVLLIEHFKIWMFSISTTHYIRTSSGFPNLSYSNSLRIHLQYPSDWYGLLCVNTIMLPSYIERDIVQLHGKSRQSIPLLRHIKNHERLGKKSWVRELSKALKISIRYSSLYKLWNTAELGRRGLEFPISVSIERCSLLDWLSGFVAVVTI